jgi:hypothetical protein
VLSQVAEVLVLAVGGGLLELGAELSHPQLCFTHEIFDIIFPPLQLGSQISTSLAPLNKRELMLSGSVRI